MPAGKRWDEKKSQALISRNMALPTPILEDAKGQLEPNPNQGAGPHLQRNILDLGAPPSLIL